MRFIGQPFERFCRITAPAAVMLSASWPLPSHSAGAQPPASPASSTALPPSPPPVQSSASADEVVPVPVVPVVPVGVAAHASTVPPVTQLPPPSEAPVVAPEAPSGPSGAQVTPSSSVAQSQPGIDRTSPPTQTAVVASNPPATSGATRPTFEFPAWTKHVKLGGGALLWYHQPLYKGGKPNLQFFNARLLVDATFGAFSVHLEPRIRDRKLRAFFDGPAWLQEAYAAWTPNPHVSLKVGKVYSQLGLFWDNSFYGNVQVYDGLKLAPEYGISFDGSVGQRAGLRYWAQYFLIDGGTNVSLDRRDTLSAPGGHRRHQTIAKLEPFARLGERGEVNGGLSAQYLQSDIPGSETQAKLKDDVVRVAAHAKLTYAAFGVWGEYLHQSGKHVTSFPLAPQTSPPQPGKSSGNNHYALVGTEYSLGPVTARYNFSYGLYNDLKTREFFHVPALAYKPHSTLTLLAELVLWHRFFPGGDARVDRSLNVTLNAAF